MYWCYFIALVQESLIVVSYLTKSENVLTDVCA